MALVLGNVQTNSGSSSNPSVTKPTGLSNGDLVIVVINHNSDTVNTSDNNGSAPFTNGGEFDYQPGAGGGSVAVFYRVIDGTEGSSLNFTLGSSQRWAIVAFAVSGEDTSMPLDTSIADGNDENSSAPTCPGVNTNTDGAMAIAVACIDGTGASFTGGPATFTEVGTVNAQQPLSVFYKIISPAGATGNQDFSTSVSINNGTLTIFAVKPAAVGGDAVPQCFAQYRRRRG